MYIMLKLISLRLEEQWHHLIQKRDKAIVLRWINRNNKLFIYIKMNLAQVRRNNKFIQKPVLIISQIKSMSKKMIVRFKVSQRETANFFIMSFKIFLISTKIKRILKQALKFKKLNMMKLLMMT